jgi:glycerol-3-phosphate acyltransferase PlsX
VNKKIVIALDGMGGDNAPAMVVNGAHIALERYPQTEFLLYGDEARLKPLLARHRALRKVTTIHHTQGVVKGEDKPSTALRKRRDSSMWKAIAAVESGAAHCVVSAGNTGALMAMAKFALRTLPGIDRPAIASFLPTTRGETVMLDLGANIEVDANNLVEFAVMGEVFARTVLGLTNPSVGLLNVGAEDLKGHDELRDAHAMLRHENLPVNYHGFVEGNDIGAGTVDVVVTDGFTGNIALKTIEGTAKLYTGFVRDAFRTSSFARLGYLLASGAWRKLRKRVDPRRYNGGVFLGLNGVCVKSHGGTDALGFAHAVGVAVDMVRYNFNELVTEDFKRLREALGYAQEQGAAAAAAVQAAST